MSAYSDMVKKNPDLGKKQKLTPAAVPAPPSMKKDGKKFGKKKGVKK